MAFAPPKAMTEKDFYEGLSKIDSYIKPIAASPAPTKQPKKEPTIFDAVKAGLMVPTQNFVKTLGPTILHEKDERGHTAAHWACLGGHAQMLRYLIEQGAPINEPADMEPNPLPIHWACTNGHIALVDVLLQQGVSIDSVDNKGCTPLIVAAQYGKTMLAGYLMGKGAKLQLTDKDGDNALHWAGFKGFEELIRLLIYSGFNVRQKDNYGQTVLHLACINGNLIVVRELCEHDGVQLDISDKNGKTPYMLAAGRKHEDVMSYLKKRIDKSHSLLGKVDFKTLVFGPPGKSKWPILFFITAIIFYGYPMYLYKCLYYTWDDLYILHVMFWITNLFMWISLYHANSADPGYLPRNVSEYDMAIKQVAHFNEWKEGDNPLSRLCHTCRTVKPIRAKHCRVCNRCVAHFDHHCPWIYNCVGYKNRRWFFSFIGIMSVNCLMGIFFLFGIYSREGLTALVITGIPLVLAGIVLTVLLFLFTIYQALKNLTTNEGINWKRYDYLKDSNGKFSNPFDRGVVTNMMEYFYLIPPMQFEKLDAIKVL